MVNRSRKNPVPPPVMSTVRMGAVVPAKAMQPARAHAAGATAEAEASAVLASPRAAPTPRLYQRYGVAGATAAAALSIATDTGYVFELDTAALTEGGRLLAAASIGELRAFIAAREGLPAAALRLRLAAPGQPLLLDAQVRRPRAREPRLA
jgi:hypothetical protein